MIIPTIPTPDELLDKGFRRGKKAADLARTSKIPRRLKSKRIEEIRVITACQVIKDRLKMILDRVPDIETLPEFYQDYIDITVGVDEMKKSLGALNWAYGIITQLEKDYASKIRRSLPENASSYQKQAYGRIASVVNKIKKDLDFLDFAKANLRNMPTIDFEATTIVIAGFPNVGKSTLLRQITNASPEVADYPFTTKGIQIGHLERNWKKIQIIDTPGLLDRPILDMNEIELNAMVALEHLADAILFIIDVSETCGYPIENQYNLSEEIKRIFNVPMIYLFNKMDISQMNKKENDKNTDNEIELKNVIDSSKNDYDANISYLNQYLNKIDEYLFISAYEGKGIEEILKKLEKVEKIEEDNSQMENEYEY
ncbi:GTPase ObgE/CgtA [Methanobrevibacter cuticularis]|uniref:GTPase ObgE/CgtA n=1 Tax=Methanobrevibacter cuticularis TaxID=47311 RepID=A0A166CYA4_9EURY|nr:NOG1 family protein [Methanobrevibacter cuticularis]KZX14990.1 GTPase ObgE/CgtA [Methanobrevibacter cuticularis]